jgi:hypothetical protein
MALGSDASVEKRVRSFCKVPQVCVVHFFAVRNMYLVFANSSFVPIM